jgi:hypothetical protein
MCRGGFGNKKLENLPTTGHPTSTKQTKKEKRGKTKDAIGGATSEPGVGEGGRRT